MLGSGEHGQEGYNAVHSEQNISIIATSASALTTH